MSAPAVHLVVPGPLDQRTGGYVYDRRIVNGLRARSREVVVHELEGAHPRADEAARRALAAFYERADLVVLASFHEGYGMVLADALARCLPVIATRAGAICDTMPEAPALATALRRVIGDPELRRRLARGASQARQLDRLRP